MCAKIPQILSNKQEEANREAKVEGGKLIQEECTWQELIKIRFYSLVSPLFSHLLKYLS